MSEGNGSVMSQIPAMSQGKIELQPGDRYVLAFIRKGTQGLNVSTNPESSLTDALELLVAVMGAVCMMIKQQFPKSQDSRIIDPYSRPKRIV